MERRALSVTRQLCEGDAKAQLLTDDAAIQGFLRLEREDGRVFDAEEILGRLQALGLVLPDVARDRVKELVARANSGCGAIEPLLLVEGEAPGGTDGRIEWLVPGVEECDSADPEDGDRVDVREAKNVVPSVKQNQPIARLVPPVSGSPGRDIFGREIPARGRGAILRAGKRVRVAEDGALVADSAGQVIVRNQVVSVEPVRPIAEDVDFSVGNVIFNGVVRVGRDVLDDFKVCGDKGVRIDGSVGAAQIRSQNGGVEIVGGVSGKGKARVQAAANVRAKYVNQAEVRASGDVIIEGDLANSNVEAANRVVVHGKIVGGETMAARSVEAGALGSTIGVRTLVTVGLDGSHGRTLAVSTEIAALRKQVADLSDSGLAGPCSESLAKLPPRRRASIEERQRVLREKSERLSVLEAKEHEAEVARQRLSSQSHELQSLKRQMAGSKGSAREGAAEEPDESAKTRAELAAKTARIAELEELQRVEQQRVAELSRGIRTVQVHRMVYAGTVVRIGGLSREFTALVPGPLRIIADEELGELRIIPWRPRG